jgi:hypothetical protein
VGSMKHASAGFGMGALRLTLELKRIAQALYPRMVAQRQPRNQHS